MTEKEQRIFFNKVKGRKIRWSTWIDSSMYFIADRLEYGLLFGTTYNYTENARGWWINRGFDHSYYAGHWILVEEQPKQIEQPKEELKCTCYSLHLTRYGCRCRRSA